ncbi:MAG: LacI family transcriptional regulator, partial [Lentisphaerae bacterium]
MPEASSHRGSPQKVTIRTIAERAGVSVGTVSHILRGKTRGHSPKVAARVKRVLKIAEELG